MKLFLCAVLVGSMGLSGATSAPDAMARVHHRRHMYAECRYQMLNHRRGFTVWEVKKTIVCAAEKFHVSLSTAMYVANRESSFYAKARNPSSGACGVYQHIPRYFPERLASVAHKHPRWGPYGRSCYDARSNIFAAFQVVDEAGWGAWSL